MNMAKVYTITNQKGGVGKTTTTINLASALRLKGHRVLAIDMDPQGNLSFSAGAESSLSATIYEVLKGEIKMQYAIQRTPITDIVSTSVLLSGIELEFTESGREFLLRQAMSIVKDFYDYVLIDTPPGLGILTINAMSASDGVIIPMTADIFSLQGITQLHDTVAQVKKFSNPLLKIEGVLLNKYDSRIYFSKEVKGAAELILKELDVRLFKTSIRPSIVIAEAQSNQADLFVYAKKSGAALDFEEFANELILGGMHV